MTQKKKRQLPISFRRFRHQGNGLKQMEEGSGRFYEGEDMMIQEAQIIVGKLNLAIHHRHTIWK